MSLADDGSALVGDRDWAEVDGKCDGVGDVRLLLDAGFVLSSGLLVAGDGVPSDGLLVMGEGEGEGEGDAGFVLSSGLLLGAGCCVVAAGFVSVPGLGLVMVGFGPGPSVGLFLPGGGGSFRVGRGTGTQPSLPGLVQPLETPHESGTLTSWPMTPAKPPGMLEGMSQAAFTQLPKKEAASRPFSRNVLAPSTSFMTPSTSAPPGRASSVVSMRVSRAVSITSQ
jgi:hypothetical protein